uniref:Uncharacterized protein n=1 Tax=Chloropicon laureae TaxID=464258 RepID=A0A7S3E2S6_9CHLO
MGFFGPSPAEQDLLWCRTNDETFRVWHWRKACEGGEGDGDGDVAMGESDDLYQLLDARKTLTDCLRRSQVTQRGTKVDYLIDCHWDASASELRLVGGSVEGGVYIFQLASVDRAASGQAVTFLSPDRIQCRGALCGGHSAVVRSLDSSCSPGYATCGEDGQLCLWQPGASRITQAFGMSPSPPFGVQEQHQHQHQSNGYSYSNNANGYPAIGGSPYGYGNHYGGEKKATGGGRKTFGRSFKPY